MEYLKYIICIIVILIVFYFAQLQNKKQNKKLKEMQDNLKIGDKIVTYSGLTGIVTEIFEDRCIIELNPSKNLLSIEKWAIAGIDDRNIY